MNNTSSSVVIITLEYFCILQVRIVCQWERRKKGNFKFVVQRKWARLEWDFILRGKKVWFNIFLKNMTCLVNTDTMVTLDEAKVEEGDFSAIAFRVRKLSI